MLNDNQNPNKPKDNTIIPNTLSIEQQIFDKRVKGFDAKLSLLQEEFKVTIVPTLVITKYGIMPQMEYRDKNETDKLLQEAKMKDAMNSNLTARVKD